MSYEDQAIDCEPKDLVVKRSMIQELHGIWTYSKWSTARFWRHGKVGAMKVRLQGISISEGA